jgi:uncharacterized tellurite resistance protein B-like protein
MPLTYINEEKKSLMLLKAIIFHYHGLDEDEEKSLYRSAGELNAHEELKWAFDFIAEDYVSAFDRARAYMSDNMKSIEKYKRLQFINLTWEANSEKGYITEMEATAMLKIAKDWEVDQELIALVQPA